MDEPSLVDDVKEEMPSLVEDLKKYWFILLVILFGIAYIGHFMREMYDFKTINSWRQTQGTILESSIGYGERKIGIHKRNRRTITVYKLNLRYSYQVEGQNHKSRQVTLGGDIEYRDETEVRSMLNSYSPGKVVTVYYHPHDHQRAVLFPQQLNEDIWHFLGDGFMIVFVGSLSLVMLSPWFQYHYNSIPPKPIRPIKEQPAFMKRRLSRRERRRQQLRQR